MHVLVAQTRAAALADAVGPRHDQRICHPALVHLSLPTTERRVARHRPAPRVVVVDAGTADLVDAVPRLVDRLRDRVPRTDVVHRTDWTTLRRCAVVRQHHEDRVVEVAGLVEMVDQAADLVVGVRQEAGERLHEPCVDGAGPVRQRVPCRHPLGTVGEHGGLGEDP